MRMLLMAVLIAFVLTAGIVQMVPQTVGVAHAYGNGGDPDDTEPGGDCDTGDGDSGDSGGDPGDPDAGDA